MSALSVNAISIDDGGKYFSSGKAITLGSGGLNASTSASSPGFAILSFPITLGASQTWSIDGNENFSGVLLGANVTGTSSTLATVLSHGTFLGLSSSDVEVGAVSITGGNLSGSPFQNGAIALSGASLNATDGNPVSLTDAGLFGEGTVGALTSTGGSIQAGAPEGILSVAGGLTLDSASGVILLINRPGTNVGQDYSQLRATENVNLSSAHLGLFSPGKTCPTLSPGEVDVLITTTRSITGTFAGIPNGATVALGCPSEPKPKVRINYTASTVTATVLAEEIPTTTTLSSSSTNPVTNQPITLTATVSATSGTPSGMVSFRAMGASIGGCERQPLTLSGSTYSATCQVTFAAAVFFQQPLSAVFTPSEGSHLQGSTSPTVRLLIGVDSTNTVLGVSNSAPAVGASVTFTATVTPTYTGTAKPTGLVRFSDAGTPIASCASQTLTPAASSSSTACTISYAAAGSHTITARYLGDVNFFESISAGLAVTVPAGSPTLGGGSNGEPGATATGSAGVLGTSTASVSSAQIAAGLAEQLLPRGKAAKIASLLRSGRFALLFKALEAGVAEIDWYQVPTGAKVAKKAKPVLVASGKLTFSAAGSASIRIRLTAACKGLLKHAKRLALTAKGRFTPPGQGAVVVLRKFTLKR